MNSVLVINGEHIGNPNSYFNLELLNELDILIVYYEDVFEVIKNTQTDVTGVFTYEDLNIFNELDLTGILK